MKKENKISRVILSDKELDNRMRDYNPIGFDIEFYWNTMEWWLTPNTYGHPTCRFKVTQEQAKSYMNRFTSGDKYSGVDVDKCQVYMGWRHYL